MTITSAQLVRATAAAAVTAGAIYVAVQIGHPPLEVASVVTTEWTIRSSAKVAMAALALAGITGMYLRQHRRIGVLGLIGYLLFTIGYLAIFSTEVIAAAVLPGLAELQPGWVNDVVVTAAGGSPAGDIGAVRTLLNVGGAGYLGGGILFGIALFRTGILARWASALLVLGALATAALAVLPEAFNRPVAVPVGVALIGLGLSLWRSVTPAAPSVSPAPELATR